MDGLHTQTTLRLFETLSLTSSIAQLLRFACQWPVEKHAPCILFKHTVRYTVWVAQSELCLVGRFLCLQVVVAGCRKKTTP
jgi:hypothetical protein